MTAITRFLLFFCFISHFLMAQEPFSLQKAHKAVAKVVLSDSLWGILGNVEFGIGTGFFVDQEMLVTNYHVIAPLLLRASDSSDFEDFLSLSYVEQEGQRYSITGIRSISPKDDLVVLKVEGYRGPVLELDEEYLGSKNVKIVGFPAIDRMPESVSQIELMEVTGEIFDQTKPAFCNVDDIPLMVNIFSNLGGMSGSPIFNSDGRVIGVFYLYESIGGVSCGTKVKYLQQLLKRPPIQNEDMYRSITMQIIADLDQAVGGDENAQYRMGELLMKGMIPAGIYNFGGKVLEMEDAVALGTLFFEELAKKGHPSAQKLVGVFLYKMSMGEQYGNPINYEDFMLKKEDSMLQRGLKWIIEAADLGNVIAQYEMMNITQNVQERLMYLNLSASQNYIPAQYALYREIAMQSFLEIKNDYKGQESVPDEFETLQKMMDVHCTWLKGIKEVADRGYPPAQFDLAQYLENAVQAGKNDYIRSAVSLYEKAGDQGHGLAQLRAGQLYYYGHGNIVEPDEEKAGYWLMRARQNRTFVPFNNDLKLITTLRSMPEDSFIVGAFKFFGRMRIYFSQMFEDSEYENYDESDMEIPYTPKTGLKEEDSFAFSQEIKAELMEIAVDRFDQCLSNLDIY